MSECNFWSQNAAEYAGAYEHNNMQSANVLRHILRIDFPSHPITVLDAGCASGIAVSLFLKQHLTTKAKIVGVDGADDMIKQAQERLKKMTDNNLNPSAEVSFVKGDLEKLSLEDSHFDYYVSNFCFQIFKNPQATIKEAWRVLKPQGKVGIAVPGRLEYSKWTSELKEAVRERSKDEGKFFSGCDTFNKESLTALLEDNGFEVLFCWYQQMTYCNSQRKDTEVLYNVLLEKYDEGTKEDIISKHEERLANYFKKKEPAFADVLFIVGEKKS